MPHHQVLKTRAGLSTASSNLITSFGYRAAAAVSAGRNAGGLMIVDGGGKFEQMSFCDAQFLESRKLVAEDIARIFGLPPTTIGLVDTSARDSCSVFE
jgi:phage portal protein BeeE